MLVTGHIRYPCLSGMPECRAAQRWHVAAVVTGFTRISQMDEYLDAFSLELSADTLAAIDDIHMENRSPQWID